MWPWEPRAHGACSVQGWPPGGSATTTRPGGVVLPGGHFVAALGCNGAGLVVENEEPPGSWHSD